MKGLKVEKINNKKEITIQPFNYSTVKLRKQCAFTLAEVLITLGIIGVVAALTIPTLISNYQKRSWVTALQKNYANLQNGFKLMAATEGVDYLAQTSFGKGLNLENGVATNDSIVESINNNLSKYFKITDAGIVGDTGKLLAYTIYSLNVEEEDSFDGAPYFRLQDGSVVYCTLFDYIARFSIDTNGEKGPNTLGRDIFVSTISLNMPIQVLTSGQYYVLFESEDKKIVPYSKLPDEYRDCGEIGSTDISGAAGTSCLDRIIEEGWKMNY